jgi:hypothetical protein
MLVGGFSEVEGEADISLTAKRLKPLWWGLGGVLLPPWTLALLQ